MIKRYLEHIHAKPTHERRQHAAQVATVVTAIVFLGWLGTLGMRATQYGTTAAGGQPSKVTQFANALSGLQTDQNSNTLEVSTTTNYTGQ